MFDVSDFEGLMDTGFGASKQPVDPKDEVFHSVYINRNTRVNEIGVTEQPLKLQARGLAYNMEKMYGIILHVKPVHVLEEGSGDKQRLKCFSYRLGSPDNWRGTDGHRCGANSAERAADPHCTGCKAQIIVSFLYTDEEGTPIVDENNQASYFFIRAKGYKYSSVADYLSALAGREDLDPLVDISTPEGKQFEMTVVRNKRFVTTITRGVITGTPYGDQNIYNLEAGKMLSKEDAGKIIQLANKTLDKFNEKMDWSRGKSTVHPQSVNNPKEQLTEIPDITPKAQIQTPQATQAKPAVPATKKINFDDIAF